VDFNGKVAVITGGASGIGYALAEQLVREGAKVAIADLEAGALQEAAARLGAVGIQTDVRRAESVQTLAQAVMVCFGRVDLVCNNAGVSVMAGVETLSLDDFRWVMDVNFFGVVHGVKAFLPHLKANPDGGWILNTASLNGLVPLPALGAYGASKCAVVGFSETLRAELEAEGSRVGVSVLCPGPVRTNIRFSARNRGEGYGVTGRREGDPDPHEQAFRATVSPDGFIDADEAAAAALHAVREGQFWAITQPELMGSYQGRIREIAEAMEAAAARRSAGQ
jgi:NAD(P)-dependent dehydrogenase (short-subunit alcohol dehydrogenase family)